MNKEQGGVFGWLLGIGLLLLIIFFVGGAFFRTVVRPVTQGTVLGASTEENRKITVTDIRDDTLVYKGLTIAVEGVTGDWVSKRAFLLAEPQGFISSGSVLVLRAEEYDLPEYVTEDQLALGEQTPVWVRGRVEELDLAQAEVELGVDLEDEAYSGMRGRPVIMVEQIEKISPQEATDSKTE